MIFRAVAAPTPGSDSSSAADAVLMSIFSPEGSVFSASAFFSAFAAAFASFASAPDPRPALTRPRSLSIVASGTPAFERPEADEYGRFSMILFASAGPTPGRDSSSLWEAELMSTFPDFPFSAADARTAGRRRNRTRPAPRKTRARPLMFRLLPLRDLAEAAI